MPSMKGLGPVSFQGNAVPMPKKVRVLYTNAIVFCRNSFLSHTQAPCRQPEMKLSPLLSSPRMQRVTQTKVSSCTARRLPKSFAMGAAFVISLSKRCRLTMPQICHAQLYFPTYIGVLRCAMTPHERVVCRHRAHTSRVLQHMDISTGFSLAILGTCQRDRLHSHSEVVIRLIQQTLSPSRQAVQLQVLRCFSSSGGCGTLI